MVDRLQLSEFGDQELAGFTANEKSTYPLIVIKQWTFPSKSVILPGCVLLFLILSVKLLEVPNLGAITQNVFIFSFSSEKKLTTNERKCVKNICYQSDD